MHPDPRPVHRRVSSVTSALMLCALLVSFVGFAPIPLAHAASVIYVKPGGTGTGLSWDSAKDLAAALSAATTGDELWVATGTYTPGSLRADTFTLKDGVTIYGGFAGLVTETLTTRDWATNVVTLSGDLNRDDGPSFANNTDNSYHVVTGATGATLDGVTISGGNANDWNNNNDPYGGGMYNFNSSPILTNVTISGNTADSGGGMYNTDNSSPTLTNVTISGNSTTNVGGGMCNDTSSNPVLTNVTISGNSTTSYGGGMYNGSSSPT